MNSKRKHTTVTYDDGREVAGPGPNAPEGKVTADAHQGHSKSMKASKAPTLKVEAKEGPKKLTPAEEKAAKKKAEQEKAYWNTLITRREALDLAHGVVAQREDSMRVMYMNLRVISDLLMEKGIITQEEMAKKSQEILKEMYGEKAINEAQARVEAMKQQSQEEAKKDSKPE